MVKKSYLTEEMKKDIAYLRLVKNYTASAIADYIINKYGEGISLRTISGYVYNRLPKIDNSYVTESKSMSTNHFIQKETQKLIALLRDDERLKNENEKLRKTVLELKKNIEEANNKIKTLENEIKEYKEIVNIPD